MTTLNLIDQLNKYDVEALNDYVLIYKDVLDIRFVSMWHYANKAGREMAMNKLVINTKGVDENVKDKAIAYLKEHGEWKYMNKGVRKWLDHKLKN